jgi:hypothetical protein
MQLSSLFVLLKISLGTTVAIALDVPQDGISGL